jgi:5-methylthioadenosine/S-adenosylhomocysteine deaminase
VRHADTLIRNAYVVTVDPQRRVFTNGYVAFSGQKIEDVGSMTGCDFDAAEVIDGAGKAVLPGMANAHNHLLQVCFRGYNDDRWPIIGPLTEAVRKLSELLYAIAARTDEERSYLLGRLHALELTKAGFTATHDEHFTNIQKKSVDGLWSALAESGLRGFLARCPVDGPNVPKEGHETAEQGLLEVERLRAKFNSDRIEVVPGIVNYSWISDPQDMVRLRDGADRLGSHFDIDMTDNSLGARLKERGFDGGQVEYYRSFGLLDTPIYAGKAVGVRPYEFEILKQQDCRVAMVPRLRYFDGAVLPVHHLLKEGILPAIGTDAPLVTDCQTPWETMRDVIFAQNLGVVKEKAAGQDVPKAAHWATAETALEMATVGGARTLFMDHKTGALEPGKDADCVVVDLDRPSMQPTFGGRRTLANLVWAGETDSVDTVFVAGKKLLSGGRSTMWDEDEVRLEAERVTVELMQESELSAMLPSRQPRQSFRGWSYVE